jgi:hypothetical protein
MPAPRRAVNKVTAIKMEECNVPMPICLFKIAQIPKSGFPYTGGIN